jgi:hypothetical protein
MKIKSLLLLLTLFLGLFIFISPVKALFTGFGPEEYPGWKQWGIGVYFAPQKITIYTEPDLNSPRVEELTWNYARVQINSATGTIVTPEHVFVSFYPYKYIAIMSVVDDTENWAKVIYDHKHNLQGWVYLKEDIPKTEYNSFVGNYFTWLQFIQNVAQKNLLYFIPGVPKKMRMLRSAPNDDAKPVSYEMKSIKNIQFKYMRGNWILVKVVDYYSNAPIGWLRWRTDDGKLLMFCEF